METNLEEFDGTPEDTSDDIEEESPSGQLLLKEILELDSQESHEGRFASFKWDFISKIAMIAFLWIQWTLTNPNSFNPNLRKSEHPN